MSRPKHTLGPWRFEGEGIIDDDGFIVAVVNEFASSFNDGKHIEYGNILAAAPDMLEVLGLYGLQYTDEQLEQLAANESGFGEIGPYEARREIIRRAAIRKAKGEV